MLELTEREEINETDPQAIRTNCQEPKPEVEFSKQSIEELCKQYKPQIDILAHCFSLLADNGRGGVHVLERFCEIATTRSIGEQGNIHLKTAIIGQDLVEGLDKNLFNKNPHLDPNGTQSDKVQEINDPDYKDSKRKQEEKKRDEKKSRLDLLKRIGLIRPLNHDERESLDHLKPKELNDIFIINMNTLANVETIFCRLSHIQNQEFWSCFQQFVTKGKSENSKATQLKVKHQTLCKAFEFLIVFDHFKDGVTFNNLAEIHDFGKSPSQGQSTIASKLTRFGAFHKESKTRTFNPNHPLVKYCVPLIRRNLSQGNSIQLNNLSQSLQNSIFSIKRMFCKES